MKERALSPRLATQAVVLSGRFWSPVVQADRLRSGPSASRLSGSRLLPLLLLLLLPLLVLLVAWFVLPSALAFVVALLSQDVVHLFREQKSRGQRCTGRAAGRLLMAEHDGPRTVSLQERRLTTANPPPAGTFMQQEAKRSAPAARKSCVPPAAAGSYGPKVSEHLGRVDLSTPAPSMSTSDGAIDGGKYAAFSP